MMVIFITPSLMWYAYSMPAELVSTSIVKCYIKPNKTTKYPPIFLQYERPFNIMKLTTDQQGVEIVYLSK